MRISTAAVAEQNGLYLIAKRKPGTSIGERWEFPGGKVRFNETPQEALIRELKEELNVDIRVGEFLCNGTFSNKGEEYRLMAFRVTIDNPTAIHSGEHQEIMWAGIEKLKKLPFPSSDVNIIKALSRSIVE